MSTEWTEISVFWKGDTAFVGHASNGGTVQMGLLDGNPGVGPMQLLLVALAGCTGVDVLSILHKKRYKLEDMRLEISGRKADDYPMIWKEIKVKYLIWGDGILVKDVEQAIQLSEEKYCGVFATLKKAIEITSDFEITETKETA